MAKGPDGSWVASPMPKSESGMHQTMKETGSCNGMIQGKDDGWINSPPKK